VTTDPRKKRVYENRGENTATQDREQQEERGKKKGGRRQRRYDALQVKISTWPEGCHNEKTQARKVEGKPGKKAQYQLQKKD